MNVIDLAAAREARQTAAEGGDFVPFGHTELVGDDCLDLVCDCGAELFIVRLTVDGIRLTCPECEQDMTGALDVHLD